MNLTFAYVYDSFLTDRKYERDLANVETELARLGVEGKVIRLAMFRQARELIIDAMRSGVRNLVFVGNDRTLQSALPILPTHDLTVGFIPMEKVGTLGREFAIPTGPAAAEVLAARRIELFDLGTCNGRPFLVDAVASAPGASLSIEGRYRVGSDTARLEIRNLTGTRGDDGKLDAYFLSDQPQGFFARWKQALAGETHLPFVDGELACRQGVSLMVDGDVMQGERFSFGVLPRALKCIVGKTRQG